MKLISIILILNVANILPKLVVEIWGFFCLARSIGETRDKIVLKIYKILNVTCGGLLKFYVRLYSALNIENVLPNRNISQILVV